MALRARLTAPPPPPRQVWPWHTVKWASVTMPDVATGQRRLAARTYLSSGYGIARAIVSKPSNWLPFEQVADVLQPPRTKATLVRPEFGAPFLIANQMFEVRPAVRKWLSLEQLGHAEELFVPQGSILVRRSADVGRSMVTCAHHEKHLISDHFFRIVPRDKRLRGWIYAFIRSPQARAMMTGTQYGHIIQHIERGHLRSLPVPLVDDATAAEFETRVQRIVDLRNEGHRLAIDAEAAFEKAIGPLAVDDWGESGFEVRASVLFRGRRRLDAIIHNPGVSAVKRHLAKNGKGFIPVAAAGFRVWLPSRFRRIPAPDGVPLVESGALLEVNPKIEKRIAEVDFGDAYKGRVHPGWVLVARSGQVYGINGTAVIATKALAGYVVSDDVIRVAPTPACTMPAGYLLVALSHPFLGRPLVKALAYGSSIPHIDPTDFASLPIVRLDPSKERAIAQLAEASARAMAEADAIESEIAGDAASIVDEFLKRPALRLVGGSGPPLANGADPSSEFTTLAAQWRQERPRGSNVTAMASTPAYRAVIKMGERAVRPILLSLRRQPDHWFVALNRITGENPVSPRVEGKVKAMAEAWLRWGKERGYLSELD
jgi:hypothetical protein